MKKTLSLLATVAVVSLFGQNPETAVKDKTRTAPYFLSLTNGKTIYTDNLRYEDTYTREGVLIVDNKDRYNLRDVKDYQTEEGVFKKMPSAGIFNGAPIWYKQEDAGRIKEIGRAHV